MSRWLGEVCHAQGDIESVAQMTPKQLTELFEKVSGSGLLKTDYEARQVGFVVILPHHPARPPSETQRREGSSDCLQAAVRSQIAIWVSYVPRLWSGPCAARRLACTAGREGGGGGAHCAAGGPQKDGDAREAAEEGAEARGRAPREARRGAGACPPRRAPLRGAHCRSRCQRKSTKYSPTRSEMVAGQRPLKGRTWP